MGVRSAGEGQVSMEVAIELRDTVQRGVRVSRSLEMGCMENQGLGPFVLRGTVQRGVRVPGPSPVSRVMDHL